MAMAETSTTPPARRMVFKQIAATAAGAMLAAKAMEMQRKTVLLDAEERLREVREAVAKTTTDAEMDRIWPECEALQRAILNTAPTSMVDVAVKLRLIADPAIGLEVGDRPDGGDVRAIRQVLAFVESRLAAGRPA